MTSEIALTKTALEANSAVTASLKAEIESIAESVKALSGQQHQLLKENSETLKAAAELKAQLNDSINSVKVMSSSIQNNLVRKITDEITLLAQEISNKFSGTERLKKEVEDAAAKVRDELAALKGEISRLHDAASKIKAQDFELVKFAGQLQQDDSEKLKLMRQIDSLQRLVSSLRRRTS